MHTPASALRRKSQVFVEIPPSPLHSAKSAMVNRAGLQVSTPFKTVATNVDNLPSPSTASASLKRKSPDASHDMPKSNDDPQPPKAKKTKAENPSTKDAPVKKTTKTTNASDGPTTPKSKPSDGTLRCHQCARLVDPSAIAQCTFTRPKGERCTLKYCKACLRNRYQQDIADVKSQSPEGCPDEVKAKHASGTEYIFQCPRCQGECNCRGCRKVMGLPATGDLNLLARKVAKQATNDPVALKTSDGAGPSTALTKLVPPKKTGVPSDKIKDTKAKSKLINSVKTKAAAKPKAGPSRLKPHVLIPPSPYKTGTLVAKKPQVVKKPTPPPKPIPKPLWSLVSTPLTFDGAVERMHIREFLLRFAHLADIARSHLEELEELAASDPYLEAADNDEESDAPQLVGWISEAALRAILIGVLTLLSNDAAESEDHVEDRDADERAGDASALTTAIQQVRGSGAHVSKMWAALETLRSSSSLAFPDALPAPANTLQRSTRTSRNGPNASTSTVISTSQLVPVLAALVEAALRTHAVQDDFERAVGQERDLARAARDLAAAENARHKASKDAILAKDKRQGVRAEQRAEREAHEAALAGVECAHRLAAAECVPRFGPLGRDAEGRVYFAVTPGVVEREAAVELLEGGEGGVRFGRRKGVGEKGERGRMRFWSWFVAVWGRRPEGALVAKSEGAEEVAEGEEKEGESVEKVAEEGEKKVDGDDRQAEDEDTEQWWGFWEPEEIAKLAEWLAMRHGINLEKKLVPKSSEDTTILGVTEAQKGDKPSKFRGRPSIASSAASSARASFANVSDSEDDFEDERERDEDDEGVDDDGDVLMRVDAHGEPVPTKRDLRKLAQGLKEYSELLAWRIKRASKDGPGKDTEKKAGTEEKDNGKGKGKAVESPLAEGIAPTTFYGKK
ncbi:hypothetical protein GSI_01558 [Ganoderma sinense ZZ0214-1]|uniref:Zinc-finger domain-containing protein n=1 Tax=Ganoderma sinense ZZ0214-1 TaxID=1077348 RepID=A0A2G8SQP7_9APHY|nr:hypothetical protein GSI_01558 [Ganoderma sinense ZZ0214-1]